MNGRPPQHERKHLRAIAGAKLELGFYEGQLADLEANRAAFPSLRYQGLKGEWQRLIASQHAIIARHEALLEEARAQ